MLYSKKGNIRDRYVDYDINSPTNDKWIGLNKSNNGVFERVNFGDLNDYYYNYPSALTIFPQLILPPSDYMTNMSIEIGIEINYYLNNFNQYDISDKLYDCWKRYIGKSSYINGVPEHIEKLAFTIYRDMIFEISNRRYEYSNHTNKNFVPLSLNGENIDSCSVPIVYDEMIYPATFFDWFYINYIPIQNIINQDDIKVDSYLRTEYRRGYIYSQYSCCLLPKSVSNILKNNDINDYIDVYKNGNKFYFMLTDEDNYYSYDDNYKAINANNYSRMIYKACFKKLSNYRNECIRLNLFNMISSSFNRKAPGVICPDNVPSYLYNALIVPICGYRNPNNNRTSKSVVSDNSLIDNDEILKTHKPLGHIDLSSGIPDINYTDGEDENSMFFIVHPICVCDFYNLEKFAKRVGIKIYDNYINNKWMNDYYKKL